MVATGERRGRIRTVCGLIEPEALGTTLMHEHLLIDRGHGARVVVSHDICTKTRLVTYGGHGYGHIVRNVVPLMRAKGFSEDEIDTTLVRTPRRLLTLDG